MFYNSAIDTKAFNEIRELNFQHVMAVLNDDADTDQLVKENTYFRWCGGKVPFIDETKV